MSTQSRKHRGYATQRIAAARFALRGKSWRFATSTGAGESGVDIKNLPGLSPEVKARPGDVTGALKQAVKNRGEGLPFVIWRPNGYGPERAGEWPVIFTFDDALDLLEQAGYTEK